MAITITQAFNSGPVTLDDRNEVRVREWEIRSTDPAGDDLQTEADVVSKILDNVDPEGPFSVLPRIGDTWEGYGDPQPILPVESMAQPRDIVPEPRTSLRCVGGRITMIGAAGAGGISGFLYTTQYSTRPSAWEVSRAVEFSARTMTAYLDLDAVLSSQGVSASPAYCESWTSINTQPPIPPAEDWSHEANIKNGEGIDVLEPLLTLTYRKLVYGPDTAALLENIQNTILTTNGAIHPPDFTVLDRWLFVGVSGSEIRSSIYDMTFKFLYSENNHRLFWYRTEQGSQLPLIDPNTGLPQCRTYRGYPRADSWSPLMELLFPDGPP